MNKIIISLFTELKTNTENRLIKVAYTIGQTLEKAWGDTTPGLREPLEGVSGEVSERTKGEDTERPSSSLTKKFIKTERTICWLLF